MGCLNAEDCQKKKPMTLDSGMIAVAHFYNIHSFIHSLIIHPINIHYSHGQQIQLFRTIPKDD